ncbi:uncharacterized protein [Epargyreus clarus]|uniref:uncharacterized protein n=1 Tax=Epargyreus clarus TaxID=520877 RepID=UPI003C2D7F2C
MSDLKELIAQRGRIKTRVTLFEKYLSPILNTKLKKTQCNELSLRLSKLQDLLTSFEDVQIQIESLDPNYDSQISEREEFENKCYSIMASAQELLQTSEIKLKEIEAPECESSSPYCHNNIKLPALRIPLFNGDPNKWLEFRDMFLTLIHDNNTIANINKFHYLRSYLEGSAAAVINSVALSSNNYGIAWSLLCDRYNNKRLLINEHIKCLFSIETISKESAKSLRDLVDMVSKNLSSLKILGESTDQWDSLIIYMASSKLDSKTARDWEEHRNKSDSSSLSDFFDFLHQRATVLETVHASKSEKPDKRQSIVRAKSFIAASSSSPGTSTHGNCLACNQEHKLYNCVKFKTLPVEDRISKVFQWQLCNNCLRSGHKAHQCKLGGCRICKRKHNTVLHKQSSFSTSKQLQLSQNKQEDNIKITNKLSDSNDLPTQSKKIQEDTSYVVSMSAVSSNHALLSTALVEVTSNGKTFTLRALLDSGSQSSFITEAAAAKIGAMKIKNRLQSVSGLNNVVINITEHCDLVINSSYNSFSASVKCFILPFITDRLPHLQVRVNDLCIPNHVKLADPKFFYPSEIDVLLGADIFWDLIRPCKFNLGPNKPLLQETELGWVVAGPLGMKFCDSSMMVNRKFCHFSKDIQTQLSKFWELEEIPSEVIPSFNEHICEKLFQETTHRTSDGRFCVQIPLRDSPDVLGESHHIAEKRLLQMEKKMRKNNKLRIDYNKFMQEYESLGHMSEVAKPLHGCYLPHHAVIRESSETTKLRVVFDASAETTTGISLNDIQYVGPVVQDDLFSILLRFRQHQYVVSADVEKMYRQILVNPEQRPLQMILWRDSDDLPIKIFQLNTVTYGTASAPYLSTRCLLQLSNESQDEKISNIIKSDMYVDDFLSGSDSKEELTHIINEVTKTLASACLPLRKFRTNAPSIFENNPNSLLPKNLDLSSQSSALGLKWDPADDILLFPCNFENSSNATKRTILSNSAKLFDPLGLLSVCTIIPKIILQKLWLSKLDWDDVVPHDVERAWLKFINGLNELSTLRIPRCVLSKNPETTELHVFCDASQDAYAACVYLRSIDSSGKIAINLLCAKTKVAPVKPQTIPRLELCGALLGARLTSKVLQALRLKVSQVYYWTDSSVVLGWLSYRARDLKQFVSNRVAEIQQLTSSGVWRHIPGLENPADLASRGLDPNLINKVALWWQGPRFLLQDESNWPNKLNISSDIPERKNYSHSPNSKNKGNTTSITCTTITNDTNTRTKPNILTTTLNEPIQDHKIINFERFSRFTTLQRSMAYVLRFIFNLKHTNTKIKGFLTTDELQSSLNYLIKQHQSLCFETELKLLLKSKCLPSRSRLLSLRPFVDDSGILRVGGRIQNSSENYDKIHPVLLDSNDAFTKLLFAHVHGKLLHGGPQVMLNNLRQNYWPINGRKLARSTVNKCKICRILKAKTVSPIMGNLPSSRVTVHLPFQISGVDFAGPFFIRDRTGRGCKIIKCYLCLFICFSTKAVHLELASDLSTDTFILCLRRFASRRGKPSEIHCDNGRNFVGANNELNTFLKSCNESISSFAADEGIKFKFSPAYAPHFGGLWEAGVKSAKHHLYRIFNNQHFTYEELSTLFVQIEAILNSRPLTPMSTDPTDLLPLTPGHFLIGKPLTSLPSPALLDMKTSRLNRYNQLEQMRQHFWERWRNEFLCELQQRAKWRIKQGELLEGDMVVLKEPNLPPLKWRMGRIKALYPGNDGIARVADVNTEKGIVRRAVQTLCPLPVKDEDCSQNP